MALYSAVASQQKKQTQQPTGIAATVPKLAGAMSASTASAPATLGAGLGRLPASSASPRPAVQPPQAPVQGTAPGFGVAGGGGIATGARLAPAVATQMQQLSSPASVGVLPTVGTPGALPGQTAAPGTIGNTVAAPVSTPDVANNSYVARPSYAQGMTPQAWAQASAPVVETPQQQMLRQNIEQGRPVNTFQQSAPTMFAGGSSTFNEQTGQYGQPTAVGGGGGQPTAVGGGALVQAVSQQADPYAASPQQAAFMDQWRRSQGLIR